MREEAYLSRLTGRAREGGDIGPHSSFLVEESWKNSAWTASLKRREGRL